MTEHMDGEGRGVLAPVDHGVGEDRAVGVQHEKKAFVVGVVIDRKEVGGGKYFPAGEIQEQDFQVGHLVNDPFDFCESQLSRKELPLVIGVGITMDAMEIAAIGDLHLRLDYPLTLPVASVESQAEVFVFDGPNGS